MEHNEEYDAVRMGELVAKKIEGQLSEQEEKILTDWLNQSPEYINAYEVLKQEYKDGQQNQMHEYDVNAALEKVLHKYNQPLKKKRYAFWYAAASILLCLSIGTYWFLGNRYNPNEGQLVSEYGGDVLAGTNKAVITLSDGLTYELDNSQEGVQVNDKGITYENGEIITNDSGIANATITTPKGSQYRITLPDGTKVILNAATSLTYPIRFTGKERLVELDGEAYFDVVHDSSKPFRLKSGIQELVVLGTTFNVSTYKAVNPITTLIEGKVSLQTNNSESIILSPGQQSILDKDTYHVQTVSTEDYTSWMHNQFVFNDMPLAEVFSTLERWYDVSFDYPQDLVNQKIYAEITRERKLSEVLKTLEEIVNLNFKIEERRVIVGK